MFARFQAIILELTFLGFFTYILLNIRITRCRLIFDGFIWKKGIWAKEREWEMGRNCVWVCVCVECRTRKGKRQKLHTEIQYFNRFVEFQQFCPPPPHFLLLFFFFFILYVNTLSSSSRQIKWISCPRSHPNRFGLNFHIDFFAPFCSQQFKIVRSAWLALNMDKNNNNNKICVFIFVMCWVRLAGPT